MNFKKIFTDSLFSSGTVFLEILRGIVLIPIITKFLGEAEYGTWVVLMAIVTVSVGVGGMHLHGSMIRFKPRENTEGQTLVDVLCLGLLSALVVSTVVYFVGWTVGLIPGSNSGQLLLEGMAVLIGSKILFGILSNVPRANNQVKIFELIRLLQLALETMILGTILWWFRDITVGVWTLVGLYTLFCILLGCIYLPKRLVLPNPTSFWRHVQYGVPMVPKEMGGNTLSQADKYLLATILSPTAAAIYAVAYSMARILKNLTKPLNPTLYPEVIAAWEEGDFRSLEDLYTKIFRWYTIFGIPAVVGLSILARPLLELISTPQIASQGQYVLPPLAIAFLIRGYDNPLAYLFNAAERNLLLTKIIVAAAVMNIALNVVLIPILKITGAVMVTLGSQILVAGYIYAKSRSWVTLDFPVTTLLRTLFSSAIMAAVLLLHPFTFLPMTKLVVYPAIGVLIYFFILAVTGELSIEEAQQLIFVLRN